MAYFECKSHYWITKSKVEFAREWSFEEIKRARKKEKMKYFNLSFWNKLVNLF